MQQDKPTFSVAVSGLPPEAMRIIEVVFRHIQHNQFGFYRAAPTAPGSADLLIRGTDLAALESEPPISAYPASRTVQVLSAPDADAAHPYVVLAERLLPDLLPRLNVLAARELLATAQSGLERPHVAVIMADHAVRLELWTQLLALGVAVTVFADAAAARVGLAALRPALILVDCTLPDADGAALAWALRGDRAEGRCPVWLLSTKVSWREVIRSAWRGLDGYLALPAAPAELRRLVGRYGAALALRPEMASLASP